MKSTINKICPITGREMKPAFTGKLLGKYKVTYFYGEESGLLQTERPYWLEEAYQSAIAATDPGLVSRNIYNLIRLQPILSRLLPEPGRFLDLGGGYGLLARLLRDIGFDAYTYDRYCANLFAKGFEPGADFTADALFAFELFEHLEEPRLFLHDNFLKYRCRTLIFSTLTFSGPVPPADWWYYAFETGQHISFYQPRTLALLAEQENCRYYRLDPNFHLITDQPVSVLQRWLFANKYLCALHFLLSFHRIMKLSRTRKDYLLLKKELNR